MQLHQFQQNKNQKSKKRIGRGGKRGTYSGHGIKGQKSRAGAKIRPEWRDVIKQIPKRRGYRFKVVFQGPTAINIGVLSRAFKEGELVSPKSLLNKRIIGKIKGKIPEIKILGDGEMTKKLSFKGFIMSEGAKEKVKKAGGTIS